MSNKIIYKSGDGCTAKFEYLEMTVTDQNFMINKLKAD